MTGGVPIPEMRSAPMLPMLAVLPTPLACRQIEDRQAGRAINNARPSLLRRDFRLSRPRQSARSRVHDDYASNVR